MGSDTQWEGQILPILVRCLGQILVPYKIYLYKLALECFRGNMRLGKGGWRQRSGHVWRCFS
ncbi:hypothetical protein B0H12DRAFT_1095232 [Mycena haematopus]|nr:hypothetical protein B0H12DRAFT_1095232 [Mycena haematopus]